MLTERISLAGQTHYAALLQALSARDAGLEVVSRPGSFVTKQIGGGTYWYFQTTDFGRQTQTYVGRHTLEIEGLVGLGITELEELRERSAASARLVALATAGGCKPHTSAERRVLQWMERRGAFAAGAVLVGSSALLCVGNMLGVRWDAEVLRTEDLDVAADPAVLLARALDEPVPKSLQGEGAASPLVPVPTLNHKHPSTSFRVRGSELLVDFLAPLVGRPRAHPVKLHGLGVFGHPLRFLDYLVEDPVSAAVVGGEGVLVLVPSPARFALHKLLVASERSAAFATKAQKDVSQCAALLAVLLEDRPGDILVAWEALQDRGAGWRKRVARSARQLPGDLRSGLSDLTGASF